MSEYLEYGNFEEDVKSLLNEIRGFYKPEFEVISDALWQMYKQGAFDVREEIAKEIENSGHLIGCYRKATYDNNWRDCNCGLDRHVKIARGQWCEL